MAYRELDDERARHLINAEQAFDAYQSARSDLKRRYAGSMTWKTVEGREYLYRARQRAWKSLGPRSPETEAAHESFQAGRLRARNRSASLAERLDRMAALNRAYKLGRVPVIAARILRALADANLTEPVIVTVGTNALFAYERMAGVEVAAKNLETADIDLLYDARASLKLLAPAVAASGVAGLLRKVDRSFEVMGEGGFRASNSDGYIVDLITPAPKDPMRSSGRRRIGAAGNDLAAIEIVGLSWLVNSPKVRATVIDLRGYPAEMIVPDPRAFALHKAWLSDREDRHPLKRDRDRAQAELVARLLAARLPHLRFDDPALKALPLALRLQAPSLMPEEKDTTSYDDRLEPDW